MIACSLGGVKTIHWTLTPPKKNCAMAPMALTTGAQLSFWSGPKNINSNFPFRIGPGATRSVIPTTPVIPRRLSERGAGLAFGTANRVQRAGAAPTSRFVFPFCPPPPVFRFCPYFRSIFRFCTTNLLLHQVIFLGFPLSAPWPISSWPNDRNPNFSKTHQTPLGPREKLLERVGFFYMEIFFLGSENNFKTGFSRAGV
jgi:hypothetical protein